MVTQTVPEPGQMAPDFKLKGPGGAFYTLSEHLGQSPVVLVFFPLAFSAVCSHQLPEMEKLMPHFEKAGAVVLRHQRRQPPRQRCVRARAQPVVPAALRLEARGGGGVRRAAARRRLQQPRHVRDREGRAAAVARDLRAHEFDRAHPEPRARARGDHPRLSARGRSPRGARPFARPRASLAGEPASALAGRSREIQQLREQVRHLAATLAPVLLEGEPGSGKSVVARALHYGGPRRDRRFERVDCGARSRRRCRPRCCSASRARPGRSSGRTAARCSCTRSIVPRRASS